MTVFAGLKLGDWRRPTLATDARINVVRALRIGWLVVTLLTATAAWSGQPTSFKVRIDISQVPKAKPYVEPTRKLIKEWYPKINAILFGKDYPLPLKEVQVIFEPKTETGSGAHRTDVPAREDEDLPRSLGKIHVNFGYLERVHYPYLATMIHELTHVNQQYKNCPEWLLEGIADYVRHKYYERDIEPKLPMPIHEYQVDQARFRKEGYLAGYTITAPFLYWLEMRKDSDLLTTLNHALLQGNYSEALFRERCGASVEALWSEFISQCEP